jgi:hypothetical protein
MGWAVVRDYCLPSANAPVLAVGEKMITELTEFSSVIGDIYDAAVDPRLWQQALASICNYVGGYAAVLFWQPF